MHTFAQEVSFRFRDHLVADAAGELDLGQFHIDLEAGRRFIYLYHRAYAFIPIVLTLRFFKVFAAQPRLALVTSTLVESFGDVLHFAFVFVAIFLCFAASAMCLFGLYEEEYASFPRALAATFRVMESDESFDFDKIKEKTKGF